MNLNTSCFDWRDAADIALQRTSGLARLPLLGTISYRAWVHNISWPLYLESLLRKESIIKNALHEIEREFHSIAKAIDSRGIQSMIDIGCGHGLIDYFFQAEYGCDIHLVDIETTEDRHHDYRDSGAGYGSLAKARQYLLLNGVNAENIRTTNPTKQRLLDNDADLVISLFSCGFHYPVFEYADFAKQVLRPGGLFIFDMRHNSGQDAFYDIFPEYFVIENRQKHRRIAAVAPATL